MQIEEQGIALTNNLRRLKRIDYWHLIPDMTPAEIQVLAAICGGCEKNQKISDLYEICGMLPAAVSRQMNTLEKKALITRSIRRDNRRITDVFPTEQGKLINARNLQILQDYWEEVLGRIHAGDIDTMLRISQEVLDSMEAVLAGKLQKTDEEQ